jgi:hypothetical protein
MNRSQTDERILSQPEEPWVGRRDVQWPRNFKKFMGWIFLVTSLGQISPSVRSISLARQQYTASFAYGLLVPPTLSLAVTIICGIAWWTIWRSRPSARTWGIAAASVCILIFIRQFIIRIPPAWDREVTWLWVGIVGLVTFLLPQKRASN